MASEEPCDPEPVLAVCYEITRRLDTHWPQWAGYHEAIEGDAECPEAAASQVAMACINYLRRRFQEFQSKHSDVDMGLNLLDSMVICGVQSCRWQVRKLALESALSLGSWACHLVHVARFMKAHEDRREVLELIERILHKYDVKSKEDEMAKQLPIYDLEDFSASSEEDVGWEEQELHMQDKHGGYLKSHVTRKARHLKQHGVNAAQAPPARVDRQRKWERRAKAEEHHSDFEEKKKKQQREKEKDSPESFRHFSRLGPGL